MHSVFLHLAFFVPFGLKLQQQVGVYLVCA